MLISRRTLDLEQALTMFMFSSSARSLNLLIGACVDERDMPQIMQLHELGHSHLTGSMEVMSTRSNHAAT